jgi:hypothetical protein
MFPGPMQFKPNPASSVPLTLRNVREGWGIPTLDILKEKKGGHLPMLYFLRS